MGRSGGCWHRYRHFAAEYRQLAEWLHMEDVYAKSELENRLAARRISPRTRPPSSRSAAEARDCEIARATIGASLNLHFHDQVPAGVPALQRRVAAPRIGGRAHSQSTASRLFGTHTRRRTNCPACCSIER